MNLLKTIIIYGAVGGALYGLLKYFTPDMDTKNMVILILIILAIVLLLNTQCGYINEGFDGVGNVDKSAWLPTSEGIANAKANISTRARTWSEKARERVVARGGSLKDSFTGERIPQPDARYRNEEIAYEVPGDVNNEENNLYYDPADTSQANPNIIDLERSVQVNPERMAILKQRVNERRNRIADRWRGEQKYTEITPENTIPLGQNADQGYTMLDPIQWFRGYERPPVCMIDTPTPVSGVSPEGIDQYMQFDARSNVNAPENMSLPYIRDVINREVPRGSIKPARKVRFDRLGKQCNTESAY